MKTAVYIEDGVTQLVLTPENDFEKNALGNLNGEQLEIEIIKSSFYTNSEGWTRHQHVQRFCSDSLMVKVVNNNGK